MGEEWRDELLYGPAEISGLAVSYLTFLAEIFQVKIHTLSPATLLGTRVELIINVNI